MHDNPEPCEVYNCPDCGARNVYIDHVCSFTNEWCAAEERLLEDVC